MSDVHPEDRDDWPTTKRELQRIVAHEGVDTVAEQLERDRSTIYRLIRGETRAPHKSTRRDVVRFVRERGEAQP